MSNRTGDTLLDPIDVTEIHQLLALYGHVIDDRRWDDLDQLFTDDAFFDASEFGSPITRSLAELKDMWAGDDVQHPVAHHATNIVVSQGDDGTVHVRSKGLGVLRSGKVASLTYRDELRMTPVGWRLARRVASPRGTTI